METSEDVHNKTKRQIEEEHTPLWIKLFGGTIISVTFLCMITVFGYFANSLNSLQHQLNTVTSDSVTKTMWELHTSELKTVAEGVANCKERLGAIEQLAKERAILLDKSEARILAVEKDMQLLRERVATYEGKAEKAEKSEKP